MTPEVDAPISRQPLHKPLLVRNSPSTDTSQSSEVPLIARFAPSLVLSVLLAAACASTPSASLAPPATTPSTAITSPTLSATDAAPLTPTSSPLPTSTPGLGAEGWPYTADVMGLPAFGADGTAYIVADTQGADDQHQQSLVALDPAGHVKPGWPVAGSVGFEFGLPAVGPDGSIYAEECGGPKVGCFLHRLGIGGVELPGWPFEVPASSACPPGEPCVSRLVIGSDGNAYLATWHQANGQTQLIAIDAAGEIRPGWPVALANSYGWWSEPELSSDGTLFILTWPLGGDSPANLSAVAPDGSLRQGWPVPVPGISGYLLGPKGTVVVWSLVDDVGELCPNPRRTVFTVLGPQGRTLTGWPRGSTGYASAPVVGSDGTVYYISATSKVYAHDRAGEVKDGWPVVVPGARNGCSEVTPHLAPDGTIYVLGDEVTALSPEGRSRPGWPYHPAGKLTLPCLDTDCGPYQVTPAFGPDDTIYFVVFHDDPARPRAEVVALDRQGQLKPGWPYRLPIDPNAVAVGPLTESPDGRLFVRAGDLLLALDPDGRISD